MRRRVRTCRPVVRRRSPSAPDSNPRRRPARTGSRSPSMPACRPVDQTGGPARWRPSSARRRHGRRMVPASVDPSRCRRRTGRAPTMVIASAVKAAVSGVVMTSSPGPTPSPLSASASASVPFPTPTARPIPVAAANSASNASTSGPSTNQPLRRDPLDGGLHGVDVAGNQAQEGDFRRGGLRHRSRSDRGAAGRTSSCEPTLHRVRPSAATRRRA